MWGRSLPKRVLEPKFWAQKRRPLAAGELLQIVSAVGEVAVFPERLHEVAQ